MPELHTLLEELGNMGILPKNGTSAATKTQHKPTTIKTSMRGISMQPTHTNLG